MTIVLILLALSLGNAEKLGRGYLPPSELKIIGGSPGSVDDYYVTERLPSSISKYSEGLEAMSKSPSLSIKSLTEITNRNDHDQGKRKDFDTDSTLSHLEYLTSPYSLNPFHMLKVNSEDNVFSIDQTDFDSSTSKSSTTKSSTHFVISPGRNGIISNNNLVNATPLRPKSEFDSSATIFYFKNNLSPDEVAYSYDTSNGINAYQNGTATEGVKVQGSYSYIGDDGKLYSVNYTADENGFQPRGDHLPTPPPIPEAILKVIEQTAKDEDKGKFDDGSYNANKYGDEKYFYEYRKPVALNRSILIINGGNLSEKNILKNHLKKNITLNQLEKQNISITHNDIQLRSEIPNQHTLNEEFVNIMRENDERKGYFYHKPQEDSIFTTTENVFMNTEYDRTESSNLNMLKNNGIKPKPFIISNDSDDYDDLGIKNNDLESMLVKIQSDINNGNVAEINKKYFNNTINNLTNYIEETSNAKSPPQQITREYTDRVTHKPFTKLSFQNVFNIDEKQTTYTTTTPKNLYNIRLNHPSINNNLLRKLLTSESTTTITPDVLPNSTPFEVTYPLNLEVNESFTTFSPIHNVENSITLSSNVQTTEPRDLNTILSPKSNKVKDYEGYTTFDTITSLDEADNSSEYGFMENKFNHAITTTTPFDLPTEKSLLCDQNYLIKSPEKIFGEDFRGPKQPPQYDPNSGYYY